MDAARAPKQTPGRLIEPGGPVDRMRVGELIEAAARELLASSPADPKRHRIDIYRPVSTAEGRTLILRLKLTVAFATAQRHPPAKAPPA